MGAYSEVCHSAYNGWSASFGYCRVLDNADNPPATTELQRNARPKLMIGECDAGKIAGQVL
jgi:hypothetical protein